MSRLFNLLDNLQIKKLSILILFISYIADTTY